MVMNPILAVGFGMKLVAGLFVLSAICLILIVLVQKGKGGGLGAAFGGGAGGGLLGTKTGDFLTWFTIVLAGSFLLLSVVMAKWYRPEITDVQSRQQQQAPLEAQPSQNQSGETTMPEVTEVLPTDANE